MRDRELRRIRLSADPATLDGVEWDSIQERTRAEPRRLDTEVELRDIARTAPELVVATLALPSEIPDEKVVADLRVILGIGPGTYVRLPEPGLVLGEPPARAIAGDPLPRCPVCGYADGQHRPGCPCG